MKIIEKYFNVFWIACLLAAAVALFNVALELTAAGMSYGSEDEGFSGTELFYIITVISMFWTIAHTAWCKFFKKEEEVEVLEEETEAK